MSEGNDKNARDSDNHEANAECKSSKRSERIVATVLVLCIGIVGFWEVMAHRSDRPFSPFELTAQDLASFEPFSTQWFIESMPVSHDPVEPNILMCLLRPQPHTGDAQAKTQSLMLRLVHGFNLVDCMLEKGHAVELVASTLTDTPMMDGIELPASALESGRKIQVWRVTSPVGDVSLWVSTMLRAGDFAQTDVDTRAMPFPRVPYPDRAAWTPRGITKDGLKHPIQGINKFLQYKWNSSRGDLLTLLDLKQEEWASEDELTLVTLNKSPSVTPASQTQVLAEILSAHFDMHDQLKRWREQYRPAETRPGT